jgi:15-cis-phytoene synthase
VSKQLTTAYSVCRDVARSKAKNFYWGFLALPREKRDALCAVYAFMRHADDLSDEPGLHPEDRRQKLTEWSEALRAVCGGKPTDDPVLLATADTQQRFKVPLELFEQLVYGTALDSEFDRYENFDALYRYCYFVASVVGLVCIRIFGYKDAAAEPLAEKLGVAFQLTNIIRDVKEDALMQRVYLPQEDLAKFGLSAEQLSPAALNNGFNAQAFRPVLELEAERAREYYKAGDALMELIEDDSRPCLWVLTEIYRRTLDKIAANGYQVFSGRVRLTTAQKAKVLGHGLLKVIF